MSIMPLHQWLEIHADNARMRVYETERLEFVVFPCFILRTGLSLDVCLPEFESFTKKKYPFQDQQGCRGEARATSV